MTPKWTLTSCNLALGTEYSLFIYVEISGVGLMGPRIDFYARYSNSFAVEPRVTELHTNRIVLEFQATEPTGVAWIGVIASEEGSAGTMEFSKQDREEAEEVLQEFTVPFLLSKTVSKQCFIAGLSIDDSLQQLTLEDCALESGSLYQLVVYVQDSTKSVFDGSFSKKIQVQVPSPLVENTFLEFPSVISPITADGLQVAFEPLLFEGIGFAGIVEEGYKASVESVRGLYGAKGGEGCKKNTVLLSLYKMGAKVVFNFENCDLSSVYKYRLYIVIAGEKGDFESASISQGIEIDIQPSNTFVKPPYLVGTPMRNTISIQFTASSSQTLFTPLEDIQKQFQANFTQSPFYLENAEKLLANGINATNVTEVEEQVDLNLLNQAYVYAFLVKDEDTSVFLAKRLDNALGEPECQIHVPIPYGNPFTFTLDNCGLASGTRYQAVIYIERILNFWKVQNGTEVLVTTKQTLDNGFVKTADDGSLFLLDLFVPYSVSNHFTSFPNLIGKPSERTIKFEFHVAHPKGCFFVTLEQKSGIASIRDHRIRGNAVQGQKQKRIR